MKFCIKCNKPLRRENRRICDYCCNKKLRHERKNYFVNLKGGKCQICGYNKCNSCLAFHHIDPSQKEFELDINGMQLAIERVKKEVDKCILVCHNCHGEIHAGLITL